MTATRFMCFSHPMTSYETCVCLFSPQLKQAAPGRGPLVLVSLLWFLHGPQGVCVCMCVCGQFQVLPSSITSLPYIYLRQGPLLNQEFLDD